MNKPTNLSTSAAVSIAVAAVQTSAPKALPPVPGGGSWRVNATGDGWIENKPEPAQAADTASTPSTPSE